MDLKDKIEKFPQKWNKKGENKRKIDNGREDEDIK